jgi:hypothetical protein
MGGRLRLESVATMVWNTQRATEVFDKMLFQLTEKLKSGSMPIDQYNVELHKLVELRNKDFETAQSRET